MTFICTAAFIVILYIYPMDSDKTKYFFKMDNIEEVVSEAGAKKLIKMFQNDNHFTCHLYEDD